jgi:hypothetical protein
MGYAGTGSVGVEFVRLFQVELEHYEKMEGRSLSLEGKANRGVRRVPQGQPGRWRPLSTGSARRSRGQHNHPGAHLSNTTNPDDWAPHLREKCGKADERGTAEAAAFQRRMPTLEPLRGTRARVGDLLDHCPTAELVAALPGQR